METEILAALKELSSNWPDWWLAAHLADLLHHAGCPDLILKQDGKADGKNKREGTKVDLREYLLVDYGNSLFERGR